MNEEHTNGSPLAAANKDAREKMLSGSAWMTVGSITSRILGAIYVMRIVTRPTLSMHRDTTFITFS